MLLTISWEQKRTKVLNFKEKEQISYCFCGSRHGSRSSQIFKKIKNSKICQKNKKQNKIDRGNYFLVPFRKKWK